jgi:hypothetical protein
MYVLCRYKLFDLKLTSAALFVERVKWDGFIATALFVTVND